MKRLVAIVALAAMAGCSTVTEHDGGKIVEGVDTFVGVQMPITEGATRFEILNYLSGARFSFSRGAGVAFIYSVSNHVSFCGYESRTMKTMGAILVPSGTNAVINAEAETR